MDLKFIKAELLRKRVALVLAGTVLLTILFISVLAHKLNILENKISNVEDFANSQTEEYLQYRLDTQHNFLNSLHKDWETYSTFHTQLDYEDMIQNFVHFFVQNKLNLIPHSMIIVVENEGEILYIEYDNSDYDEIVDLFLEQEIIAIPDLQITNGSEKIPFGQGERFYTIGSEYFYNDSGKSFLIHLTFFEPIAYESFISTLNLDLLLDAKNYISEILYISVGFFLTIILIGILFLVILRWFVVDALKEYVNVTLLGEILISKNYISRQQLDESLKEQFKRLGWY